MTTGFATKPAGPMASASNSGVTAAPAPMPAVPAPAPGILTLPRLAPFPRRLDLGDQVIGSGHDFAIAPLTIIDGFQGTGRILVTRSAPADTDPALSEGARALAEQRAEAFVPLRDPLRLVESGTEHDAIHVKFTPTMTGAFAADLHLAVYWSDGNIDEQVVRLTARARAIDELPPHPVPDPKPRPLEASLDPDAKPSTGPIDTTLDAMANDAVTAAQNLAQRQLEGVNVVEKEVATYVPKQEHAPWWAELAELAIAMACAGIAGIVAKELGPKLARLLDAAAKDKDNIVVGMTDAVKEGLKTRLKTEAKSPPMLAAMAPKSPPVPEDWTFSSDRKIEFFTTQRTRLLDVAEDNAHFVQNQRDRMRAQPIATAVAAMKALRQTIDTLNDGARATQEQIAATDEQWIAAVSRDTRGEDHVFDKTSGQLRSVTQLVGAHGSAGTKGVLELDVDADLAAADWIDRATVGGASIRGVAQSVADQLLRVRLDEAAIPIVIVVRQPMATAWITRDEVGRVRIRGNLPVADARDVCDETQAHAAASRLVARVLSTPLRDWGIDAITTDDASRKS